MLLMFQLDHLAEVRYCKIEPNWFSLWFCFPRLHFCNCLRAKSAHVHVQITVI